MHHLGSGCRAWGICFGVAKERSRLVQVLFQTVGQAEEVRIQRSSRHHFATWQELVGQPMPFCGSCPQFLLVDDATPR